MDAQRTKIYVVYWQDAAFSYRKQLPKTLPPVQVVFGIISSRKSGVLNIAMSYHYSRRSHTLTEIVDGILIPEKTVLAIKQVGYFDEIKK